MRAVAERLVRGMFAAAPRHGFGFGDFDLQRAQAESLMRAIAERLAFRVSARAPPISAWLDFLDEGGFLGNDRFAHKAYLTLLDTRSKSNLALPGSDNALFRHLLFRFRGRHQQPAERALVKREQSFHVRIAVVICLLQIVLARLFSA